MPSIPPSPIFRSLRPSRMIEILDRAAELTRLHLLPSLIFTLLGWLPCLVCLFGFLFHVHHQQHLWGTPTFLLSSLVWTLPLALSLYNLLLFRASHLALAYSSFLGKPLSLSSAFRQTWKKRATLFFAIPLLWLLVFLSGLLAFFPIPFLLATFYLLLPVVAIEPITDIQTLRRASFLSKQLGSRHVAAFLLFRFAEFVLWLNLLFLVPLSVEVARIVFNADLSWLLRLPFRLLLLWLSVAVLLHPWKTYVLALLYLDACVRRDGWDLKHRFLGLQDSFLSDPPDPRGSHAP